MPQELSRYPPKGAGSIVISSIAAQQHVGRTGATMTWLGRCDRQHVPAQLRLLQPSRNRALEHPRPIWAKSPPGYDEHAAPSCIARQTDKSGKRPMRLGLSHSMQIEAGLDLAQTTLQPLGVRPVDPGKPVRRSRGRHRTRLMLLGSGEHRRGRLARPDGNGGVATVQRSDTVNSSLPQRAITPRARRPARPIRHLSPPDCLQREQYGDAGARAHRVRCAARYPPCAMGR
jgi:hypothetical protein